MKIDLSPYLQVFRNRRIAVLTLLGFSSGLPLALTSETLQAWMAVMNVDIVTIGIFNLVGIPYTMKFLWSPLMDRFVPPFLGRRRGWILLTQLALMSCICLMAVTSPRDATLLMAFVALTTAFFSASQDIVIDAYRTDVLPEKERGVGAALFVMGYRIAMLVSGALALILSDRIGWSNTYLFMACVMGIGVAASFFGQEPEKKAVPPRDLQEAVWLPLRDYFSRPKAFDMLLLIILYKLGDAYAGTLTTAFLIRVMSFTPTEVGAINKGLGLLSLIIGAVFGGTLMVRLGLYRSLIVFGILQAISNLSFMLLAWTGKSYAMFVFAVAFENLSGGMGTAAFVSLLMSLCNSSFSATQYALLSSLAALSRTFVTPTSGYVVNFIGWPGFFLFTAVAALPGLWLVMKMKDTISANQRDQ